MDKKSTRHDSQVMGVDSVSVDSSSVRVGKKRKSISAVSSSSSPTEVYSKHVAKVSSTAASENGSFEGPSHILFSVFNSGSSPLVSSGSASSGFPAKELENRRRRLLVDPCFEVDYIDRRKRAHESEEWSSAPSSRTVGEISPWVGVSKIERELVGCCEILDDNFYSHDNDQEDGTDGDETNNGGIVADPSFSSSKNSTGGVLAVDKGTKNDDYLLLLPFSLSS